MLRRSLAFALLALAIGCPDCAEAHFLWVVTKISDSGAVAEVYFSEDASPDDPSLLDRVAKAQAFAMVRGRSGPQALTLEKGDNALKAQLPRDAAGAPVVLKHTYGVLSRGDETFLLNYYAKTYPAPLPGTWQEVDDAEKLPFEIVPQVDGKAVVLKVLWQGKPLANAEVTVEGDELKDVIEGKTSGDGTLRLELPAAGLYSIRAKHVEAKKGELDGKAYDSSRHYSTLALRYAPVTLTPTAHSFPELPKGTTSFGGAIDGDWLYVYGGHYGTAHHYSQEGQSGDFRRLNLREPKEWESLPGGPKLTGLAMVPHNGKLYRVGGFTAENAEDEDEKLVSQDDVARFDPATGKWEELPSLPEGRSSHDVAVVGDTLYVAGGWNMQAGQETKWHETAWKMDLSSEPLAWKPVPQPPFQRRAVALASHHGKLHVLGGMQTNGGPTTATAVFDPTSGTWSEGPDLLGTGMDGFGSSAFALGDALYATTMSGAIQRLSGDGRSWEFVGQLAHPRFFHRMLPWNETKLVIVGGASMAVGKITELELLAPGRERAAAR